MRRALACASVLSALLAPSCADAQTYAVSAIPTTDLGNIASAPSGQTIFRITPATGAVTRLSGTGVRLSSATARPLITVGCSGGFICSITQPKITIAQTGTPTNRAGALQNFTVSTSGATGTIQGTPTTGNSISFSMSAIASGSTATFWLGFDLPYNGDDNAGATGIANASFAVTAAPPTGTTGSSTQSGIATAKVFRSLSLTNQTAMSFGRISRPSSGSGTVTLAPATGAVTVTGTGVSALSAVTASTANFAVSGEGAQSISVSVPASFNLTSGSSTIAVTLTPTVSGNQTLSNSLGTAGTLAIKVGGNFTFSSTTTLGAYSGTFSVTVSYN